MLAWTASPVLPFVPLAPVHPWMFLFSGLFGLAFMGALCAARWCDPRYNQSEEYDAGALPVRSIVEISKIAAIAMIMAMALPVAIIGGSTFNAIERARAWHEQRMEHRITQPKPVLTISKA